MIDIKSAGDVAIDGVPVTRIGTKATLASATLNPGMARAIRQANADVVHFHHPNPTGVLSYLSSGRRGPGPDPVVGKPVDGSCGRRCPHRRCSRPGRDGPHANAGPGRSSEGR